MNTVLYRILSAVLTVMTPAACLAAPPSIESLSSPLVQIGETAQIEIVGAGMDQVREVVFYSPGLRCSRLDHLDEYKLLATIEAGADCATRYHAFRLRGDDGFSELRTLRASHFPIIREQPRASVSTVIDLDYRNQTISGTLQSGDYDRYGLELRKGQRLTAEVDAMRLGGELLDTVLKIYDPRGKLLLASDDDSLLRQDPKLSFIAPENGRYIVELHESNYGGSTNGHYALHLGNFPATRVAYPAGGPMGTEMQIKFLAAGEPHSESLSQTVSIPVDSDGFQLFTVDGDSKSASPTPFRLSSFPNVLEQEPNSMLQVDSKSCLAPIAFNGILQTEGDVDTFAFDAEQGQALRIEVFADRIGSPIDSYLQLYDSSGKLLATNDDCDSNDSRIDFVAPAQGRYVLSIRDKLYRGSPIGVYRIELLPNVPTLTAFLPRPERTSQRQQTLAVPQGNRTLAKVGVKRERIDGEVQLRFVDLPPGVRSTPVYVPANEYWAIAILEADATAPVGGTLSGMQATAMTGEEAIAGGFAQTVDLIAESADRLYQATTVDRLPVAVTPSMPFRIELEQPKADLALDGTIELKIRLHREAGFTSPVRVDFPYLPQGCVGEPFITIDSQSDQANYKITAIQQAAEGDFKLAAIATVSFSESRARAEESATRPRDVDRQSQRNDLKDREVASNIIDLRVGPNPVNGKFFNLATELGGSASVECELQFAHSVPLTMECQLEGLPRGVTALPIRIESNAIKAVFDLRISADAPVGKFPGIQCRLSGSLDGSDVSFVVPADSDLIVAEQGKLMKAADGRVLSPLEALRKQNEK